MGSRDPQGEGEAANDWSQGGRSGSVRAISDDDRKRDGWIAAVSREPTVKVEDTKWGSQGAGKGCVGGGGRMRAEKERAVAAVPAETEVAALAKRDGVVEVEEPYAVGS
jgi:hypothetical protein